MNGGAIANVLNGMHLAICLDVPKPSKPTLALPAVVFVQRLGAWERNLVRLARAADWSALAWALHADIDLVAYVSKRSLEDVVRSYSEAGDLAAWLGAHVRDPAGILRIFGPGAADRVDAARGAACDEIGAHLARAADASDRIELDPALLEALCELPAKAFALQPTESREPHDTAIMDRTQLRDALATWRRRGGGGVTLERVEVTFPDREASHGRPSAYRVRKPLTIRRTAVVFAWATGHLRVWGRRSQHGTDAIARSDYNREGAYEQAWASLQYRGDVATVRVRPTVAAATSCAAE